MQKTSITKALTAFIYPSTEAPQYHKSHSIVLGLLAYAWLAWVALLQIWISMTTDSKNRILLNVLYCAKVNRDKAQGKYNKYRGYGDDRDPEFRMVL